MHGTTLALNTILQRRGPRLGMVVSRGNRDVLEIARSRMPSAFDFTAERETPLIPRNLVFEIDARCLSDGGSCIARTRRNSIGWRTKSAPPTLRRSR